MGNSHTLWAEKYRPNRLETYIGNEELKTRLAQCIAAQDIPHLLFVGKAGTGKTTAAKILLEHIESDQLLLNASDDNNIETVRTKIRTFAVSQGFQPRKIVLLDEFDGFTRQGQEALRNLMEQFSAYTRFILTANYIERVIEPIVSRTQEYRVEPPVKKDVKVHLAKILSAENVTFAAPDITTLVDAYFPDIRKILNEAQARSHTGTLTVDQVRESDVKLRLIDLIQEAVPEKTKVSKIRQLLADTNLRDYSSVYRVLYDRVEDFAPKQIPMAIMAIAEGQYKDALVVDKEICMMATIVQLLQVLK